MNTMYMDPAYDWEFDDYLAAAGIAYKCFGTYRHSAGNAAEREEWAGRVAKAMNDGDSAAAAEDMLEYSVSGDPDALLAGFAARFGEFDTHRDSGGFELSDAALDAEIREEEGAVWDEA